jgi:two-component system, OmpR family, sensor kinase
MTRLVSSLHSVRARLTLWYLVVLTLILAIFSGAIYVTEQQYLLSKIDNDLHSRVQQLAATYDPRSARLAARRVTKGSHSWLFCTGFAGSDSGVALLMTARGQVRQACGPDAVAPKDLRGVAKLETALVARGKERSVDQRAVTLRLPDGTSQQVLLRFAGLPTAAGHRDTAVLVVGVASDVPQQMAALLRILLLVGPLILLLCAGGGYWLAGRVLHPVQAITRTAQQIGETDLSRRLNLRRRDELGALANTFDHMLDRLEAAFARQRQFTADASHELRTPLSIVDLEAARALAQPRTPEQYRQAITIMQQENSYMARLVSDLLTLARADSGHALLRHEEVDLAEMVIDAVARLEPLAQRTGLSMIIAPQEELPVWGDAMYLSQMVTNVVENALIHAAGIGTYVRVEAERQIEDGAKRICLRIADDGPGIAAEHLPHLCDRFYRVDTARTHCHDTPSGASPGCTGSTGSGLGLAITQWIVQAHGGDLRVRSEVGHGAVFEIWLPAVVS